MAVEPLYNESRESLLNRVRINSANEEQTVALVDQKIQEVRLGFFNSLGKDRAKEIAGYSLVDNPDTDEQILIAQAAATEANWLTYLLCKSLPVVYMEDSARTDDRWNDEPLTRDSSALKEFLDELKSDIDKGLGDLKEPVDSNTGAVKSASIGADEPYLNSANFPGLGRGYGGPYG